MTTDPAPHLFWITSRAAGTTALVAASLSVCLGLLMATRMLKRFSGADLRVTHETLSLVTMAAIAVHGLSLVGDKYMHPSLLDVAVPFAGSYKTGWTTVGIISGWAWRPSVSPTTRGAASALSGGSGCTASPRSPGRSVWCTRWARAPTSVRPGSSSPQGSSSSPR